MRQWIGVALAAGCLFAVVATSSAAVADVVIRIDKSSQRMSVVVDGHPRYLWEVSTGRPGYGTPTGVFRPEWLARTYFSKKYYNSPMPHSIFFHGGFAIHGTEAIHRLGGPASHGCVRLHPANAAALYALVRADVKHTRIVIGNSLALQQPERTNVLAPVELSNAIERAERLRTRRTERQRAFEEAEQKRTALAERALRRRTLEQRAQQHAELAAQSRALAHLRRVQAATEAEQKRALRRIAQLRHALRMERTYGWRYAVRLRDALAAEEWQARRRAVRLRTLERTHRRMASDLVRQKRAWDERERLSALPAPARRADPPAPAKQTAVPETVERSVQTAETSVQPPVIVRAGQMPDKVTDVVADTTPETLPAETEPSAEPARPAPTQSVERANRARRCIACKGRKGRRSPL